MKRFRLLRADEIECRISEIDKKGRYLSLLLYKTARTDADLLDETVGSENWENDFKLVDGVLYGGIGVNYGNGLVWKWDAGTESNTEAEKGRASDAFKRAGFKHGIGRELYTAPRIKVNSDQCEIKEYNGKWKCYDNFEVAEIGYDSAERINKLVITVRGRTVFTLGAKAPVKREPPPKEESTNENEPLEQCESCGNTILSYFNGGKEVSVAKHITGSLDRYGKKLCINCIRRMQAARAMLEANENR